MGSAPRAGSDPTDLLFLSGWGFDAGVFDPCAAGLDRDGWRLRSRSDPWYAEKELYRELQASEDSFRDRETASRSAPRKLILIAWSMGTLSAIRLAYRLPGTIQALVLLAGTPCFCRRPDWPGGLDRTDLQTLEQRLRAASDQALRAFSLLVAQGSPQRHRVLRTLRAALSRTDRTELIAGLRQLGRADLRPQLRALRCPVYLLLGDRDALVPSALGAACQALLPALRLEILPRCGHAPFISHPHRVVELLEDARDAAAE